jgi:hypothetical protein
MFATRIQGLSCNQGQVISFMCQTERKQIDRRKNDSSPLSVCSLRICPYQHFNASMSLPGVSMHFRMRDVCWRTATSASSRRRAWSSGIIGAAMADFMVLTSLWVASCIAGCRGCIKKQRNSNWRGSFQLRFNSSCGHRRGNE